MCFVNLMIHQNSLDCFTFSTHAECCPHDLFRNLSFSKFLAKNTVAPGFPKMYCWGSRRCDRLLSSLLIHFLFSRQSPRSGFHFAETCSLGISPVRFDLFLLRQDATTTKGNMSVFDEPLVNTSAICCAVFTYVN